MQAMDHGHGRPASWKMLFDKLKRILRFGAVMRRNPGIPASSEPLDSSQLTNLEDDLLMEILQRVSTTESAIICKSVCKRWNYLIRSNYFPYRYLNHHLNDCYCNNPYAVFISYCNSLYKNELLTFSNKPMFKSCIDVMLACLPEERGSVGIVASFNDLLLCCVQRDSSYPYSYDYYICNPFTMQWVALPSVTQKHPGPLWVGFVCEPHYYKDSNNGQCVINYEYRYRVLRLIRVKQLGFFRETYCSETGQWIESSVLGQEYYPRTNFVSYNGKLFWYTGLNVVGYDPFDPNSTIFIDGTIFQLAAPNNAGVYGFFCIGVCRGCLRLMRLLVGGSDNTGCSNTLTIWELKDDRTREWSMEHQVCLGTMLSENSAVQEFINCSMMVPMALGFHPIDRDIVYLNYQDLVISCNVQTKELTIVGNTSNGRHFNHSGNVFPVVLPLWPTPIHAER